VESGKKERRKKIPKGRKEKGRMKEENERKGGKEKKRKKKERGRGMGLGGWRSVGTDEGRTSY